MDEAHPVAVVGFLEEVRGDEDRDSGLSLVLDDLPEERAVVDVDAGGRLVEKEDARPMQRGEREARPLAHARRQVLGLLALCLGEVEALGERPPATLELRAVESVKAGVELDVLAGATVPDRGSPSAPCSRCGRGRVAVC